MSALEDRLAEFLDREGDKRSWMNLKAGWAQSGPLVTQSKEPAVYLQARFDLPGVYTVQFGVNAPPGAPFAYQLEGEILWIVNGNPIRRVVSPMHGMSVTGWADTVRVTLRDASIPTLEAESNEYVGVINTAPGPRPAQSQPPTLRAWPQAQTLGASASVEIPVPAHSGVISFRLSVSNVVGSAPALVTFTDTNSTIYDQVPVVAGPSLFIPIPSGATEVVIQNTDTANPIIVSGLWGIDG
jgi:hypothetical protein